jgi:hypothetical protein
MNRTSRLVGATLILWMLSFAGSSTTAAAPGDNPGSAAPALSPVWHDECVDCPKIDFQVGDRALALDSAGLPHVVYGGDALYYARFDGASWHTEVIDAAPGIDDIYESPASLALDAAGSPHVSYLSATSSALRYAHRTPQGWQVETVDSLPDGLVFNYDTALALDSAGHPLIAYPKNGLLYIAAWTGSQWDIQLVDATQKVEFHVSLALGRLDQPHVSYGVWSGASLYLKYAHRMGGAWTSEIVEDGFLGEGNSIAVDSQGVPHISYLDYANSKIKYASRTPAGWQPQVVDTIQWFGGFTSLALDGADLPHITYAGPPVGVRYAHWDASASQWDLETVGANGWYTSLALDLTGQPHLVYQDWNEHCLRYLARSGDAWQSQVVDRNADVGTDNSIAFSPSRGLAISYYERSHGDLRVARQFGSQWVVETVDTAGDVGAYTAVALDAVGRPLVSYYDATNGDLKLARLTGNGWQVETVDSTGDVGMYTAIAIDAAGAPCISYYDATNDDLKLARQVAGLWQAETVDSLDTVGLHTSIALDGDSRWISYYDATHGDLKIAHWQDGKWIIETADGAGDVGAYTSLALDSAGIPHISYYDATDGDLKLAYRADGEWLRETVDAAGVVGLHTSLALDAGDRPSISYSSAGNDELRYAWRTGDAWATQVVRQGWETAAHASQVLDQHGNPFISYYDPGWRYLRLAAGARSGVFLPLVLMDSIP